MAKRTNKAQPADTGSVISYDVAVSEAKNILAKIADAELGNLRLGELADKLELIYGDRTLAKFAKEIGREKCTVERCRTVYRAWKGKLAPGPNLVSYAVLRELATHPDREQIVRDNPKITKREAQKRRRDYDEHKKNKNRRRDKGDDDWQKQNQRWFRDLCTLANDALRAAEVDFDNLTPEQQHALAQVVEPDLLQQIRAAGNALVELTDKLEELLDEQETTPPVETSAPIKRAPPEASAHVAA